MRKIALLLCIVLSLGWLSDAGLLTIKFNDGSQVKGIPVRYGYDVSFVYGGRATTFNPFFFPEKQKTFYGAVIFYSNGKPVRATRLGNGWLFSFNENPITEVQKGAK
jgi:hypothetical protein